MIFAGIITGICLTLFSVFMMYAFYERGKVVGREEGLKMSKQIFCNFKENELEYVPKGNIEEYLSEYLDDDGNELPDWYPLLIVKPESVAAEYDTRLKGE